MVRATFIMVDRIMGQWCSGGSELAGQGQAAALAPLPFTKCDACIWSNKCCVKFLFMLSFCQIR